jgi:gpW
MNFSAIATPVLQEWLAIAFQKYMEVRSGTKVTTANYTQGDGSKGVSFNGTSISDLQNWIGDLQRELSRRGIGHYEPRRAIGITYGPNRPRHSFRGHWVRL